MKLACEYVKDGMSVSDDFKSEIMKHIIRKQPDVIIETGTYIGLGSTDAAIKGIIASGHLGILVTIESNKFYHEKAMQHHIRYVKSGMAIFMHGVSLPKDWMPHEIDNDFPDYVFTDHENPNEYLKEIPSGVQYDMLDKAMKMYDYKIDMFILDSAGHLGTAEYLYITEKVKSPCYIFLDDTLHRKHYKTLKMAENDPRCTIIEKSREKFGHAIIHFKPKL